MDAVDRGESKTEVPGLPDRWRVLAELKAGGRASVWIAEDLELGEQVVLKIFPPFDDAEFRARALVEISLGQRLRHEHLVRLYDVVEVGPRLVAAMEWMSGGSLAQRISFKGEQPIEHVVQWAGQALQVLAYLHGQNLVHRDVKPSNLLLDRNDDLKLGDLGLVGRFDRGRYLPETRAAVGTPGYMAPEQLYDREPAPSWDLYALGVTLRQLLVGRRAAAEEHAPGASCAAQRKPAALRERRPDCPAWLDQFVTGLLAEKPVDRWPSAREALDVFEALRGD
jgi:serine/threonine protein kinase